MIAQLKQIVKKIPFSKRIYHAVRRILSHIPILMPWRPANAIVTFYPEFTNESEFLDAFYKALYQLLPEYIREINFCINFSPTFSLENPDSYPRLPYLAPVPEMNLTRVKFIYKNKGRRCCYRLIWSDYILAWDWTTVQDNRLLRVLKRKLKNVDRNTNVWDGWTWPSVCHELRSSRFIDAQEKHARQEFDKYLAELPVLSKVYLFGTGPSLDQAYSFDFSDGYRVVCNTIVKNRDLLRHIRPHFIVAADAIYHFGNNQHAFQFREDLARTLSEYNVRFLTQDFYYLLMSAYFPEIIDKVIPLRTNTEGVVLDLKKDLAYTNLPNILNGLLLPLGSTLSDSIFLLGFDGRGPLDTIFWKNSNANAYNDLKATIQAAHPAFFKGIDYDEYARIQSDTADMIMAMGEKMGKKYCCLNKTYIPALAKRQCGES